MELLIVRSTLSDGTCWLLRGKCTVKVDFQSSVAKNFLECVFITCYQISLPSHQTTTICKGSDGWFCAGDFNSIVLALGEAVVLGSSHLLMQLKCDLENNVGASFPGVTR